MERSDFYSDRKYCDHCDAYVPYLMSIDASYCVHCGREVHLFSKEDWKRFHESLAAKRPKGGRPRKQAGPKQDKESA